tara:strand:- start:624 stop:1466 length:843 start_codon:yes stop_codon:yes gene_type:complete
MGFFNKIESLEEIPQFEVEKVELYDAHRRAIPDTYSLQRTDDHTHLGVVKEKYVPIQLEEMLDIINTASNQIGNINHVGYTESKNGRKVVIQSELEDKIDVEGDVITPMFYTVIDNTGGGSNKAIPSTIRIACDNQFHLLQRENKIKISGKVRAYHNNKFVNKVDSMVSDITGSIRAAQNFESIIKQLKEQLFTQDQMIKFTQQLIPVEKGESSKRIGKREKIVSLYESGRGNVGETRWDAFNAVTEFETHKTRQTPEKLIRNLTMPTLSRTGLELLLVE